MKRMFFIVKLFLLLLLMLSIDLFNVKLIDISFKKQVKNSLISSLYFSLEKDTDFYIEIDKFEEKSKELILILINNYSIEYYSLDVGYYLENEKCKGVSICLDYKIKSYYQKMSINYLMKS